MILTRVKQEVWLNKNSTITVCRLLSSLLSKPPHKKDHPSSFSLQVVRWSAQVFITNQRESGQSFIFFVQASRSYGKACPILCRGAGGAFDNQVNPFVPSFLRPLPTSPPLTHLHALVFHSFIRSAPYSLIFSLSPLSLPCLSLSFSLLPPLPPSFSLSLSLPPSLLLPLVFTLSSRPPSWRQVRPCRRRRSPHFPLS